MSNEECDPVYAYEFITPDQGVYEKQFETLDECIERAKLWLRAVPSQTEKRKISAIIYRRTVHGFFDQHYLEYVITVESETRPLDFSLENKFTRPIGHGG